MAENISQKHESRNQGWSRHLFVINNSERCGLFKDIRDGKESLRKKLSSLSLLQRYCQWKQQWFQWGGLPSSSSTPTRGAKNSRGAKESRRWFCDHGFQWWWARILEIWRKWENSRRLSKYRPKKKMGRRQHWARWTLLTSATLGLVNIFCYLVFSNYLANMLYTFSIVDCPHLSHPWTGKFSDNFVFW